MLLHIFLSFASALSFAPALLFLANRLLKEPGAGVYQGGKAPLVATQMIFLPHPDVFIVGMGQKKTAHPKSDELFDYKLRVSPMLSKLGH
jgi:hypothetical protein